MIVYIIKLAHLLLVLYLFSSIFIKDKLTKIKATGILLFLLFHYVTNYGKCGLTEIEYLIMGEKYQEGFLYRLIKPVISLPEKYFEEYLFIIHIIWLGILLYQINTI